jgi:hypothetical protein
LFVQHSPCFKKFAIFYRVIPLWNVKHIQRAWKADLHFPNLFISLKWVPIKTKRSCLIFPWYFVEVNALGTLHTDTKHNAKTNHQMASMIWNTVLEMNIWIYWSLSNSRIYFYIFLNKNWKNNWSEQNCTGLGPEDWCSSWWLFEI